MKENSFELGLDSHGQDPNLLGGNVLQVDYKTLGEFGLGKGSVGEGTVVTPELSEKFSRILSGEFDDDISQDSIASICIDERFYEDGTRSLLPRSAGGPVGNAHAHDIAQTTASSTEIEIVKSNTAALTKGNEGVSAHGDNHGPCGCGQTNKAQERHQEISDSRENLGSALNALGYQITPERIQEYGSNAKARVEQGDYFAKDRASVLDASRDSGAGFEELVGDHDGQFILIKTKPGKTPEMQKVKEELGVSGFVVHAWAFPKTAEALNSSGYQEETDRTVETLALLNLATASILCHEDIPVIVD